MACDAPPAPPPLAADRPVGATDANKQEAPGPDRRTGLQSRGNGWVGGKCEWCGAGGAGASALTACGLVSLWVCGGAGINRHSH